jgi:cytochrome c biogenesis protein CcmG/thiol:disulfide interchange protein DsbE
VDAPESEPVDQPDADADADPTDGRRARRRGPIFFIALGMAVVLAVFVGVLATRKPAQDRIANSPLVGQVAPPVRGTSLTSGQHFDLDELRGEWVVVNFFATWCVPCRVEHPELLSFSRRHAQAGDAAVVSVVFDDDVNEVRQYFKDNDSTWPVIDGSGTGVILDYAVAAVPESFIISPTGYVVAKVTGGVTSVGLDQLIQRLSGGTSSTSTTAAG